MYELIRIHSFSVNNVSGVWVFCIRMKMTLIRLNRKHNRVDSLKMKLNYTFVFATARTTKLN